MIFSFWSKCFLFSFVCSFNYRVVTVDWVKFLLLLFLVIVLWFHYSGKDARINRNETIIECDQNGGRAYEYFTRGSNNTHLLRIFMPTHTHKHKQTYAHTHSTPFRALWALRTRHSTQVSAEKKLFLVSNVSGGGSGDGSNGGSSGSISVVARQIFWNLISRWEINSLSLAAHYDVPKAEFKSNIRVEQKASWEEENEEEGQRHLGTGQEASGRNARIFHCRSKVPVAYELVCVKCGSVVQIYERITASSGSSSSSGQWQQSLYYNNMMMIAKKFISSRKREKTSFSAKSFSVVDTTLNGRTFIRDFSS